MSQPLFRIRAGAETSSGLKPSPQPMNVQLWKDGSNVEFFEDGPEKIMGWTEPFTVTASSPIRGMGALLNSSGVKELHFGDKGKIWMWNESTMSELGSGFTGYEDQSGNVPASVWSFAPYGNFMLATNGKDTPQIRTTGSYAAMSGLPCTKAAIIKVLGAHIMLINTDSTNGGPTGMEWSDEDSYTDWTPAADNLAGNYVIRDASSPIKAAVELGEALYLFNDDEVYRTTYIGAPFVFSTKKVLNGIGAASKCSVVEANRRLYGLDALGVWMFDGMSFMRLDTSVIRQYIKDNLDTSQLSKVVAQHITERQLVRWFLPDVATGEPSFGIGYHYNLNAFTKYSFGRSAGLAQVKVFNNTWAADNSRVYMHESGTDAAGSAISAYVQTKPLDFGDPALYKLIDMVALQIDRLTGTISVQVGSQNNVDDDVSWSAAETLDDGFESVHPRPPAWGRFVTLKLSSSAVGAKFRLSGFDMYGELTGREV